MKCDKDELEHVLRHVNVMLKKSKSFKSILFTTALHFFCSAWLKLFSKCSMFIARTIKYFNGLVRLCITAGRKTYYFRTLLKKILIDLSNVDLQLVRYKIKKKAGSSFSKV